MPCISMFSRFKADRSGGGGGGGSCGGGGSSNGAGGGSSSPSQTLLEGNAITTFFEIGRQTATAGPGYLWKVHDAYRKSDGKVKDIIISLISSAIRYRFSFALFFFHSELFFFFFLPHFSLFSHFIRSFVVLLKSLVVIF